jgi:soluble lytic murein transglycosylase-like protein
MNPLLLACVLAVSQVHGLPPRVLPAVQATEGGWLGAVSRNTNGTEDLGLMQVNTLWLAPLARGTGLPPGEVRRRLIWDGCFSVAVAGAILRLHLMSEGGNLMRAIGNYHSRTPSLNEAYQARVLQHATRMFGRSQTRRP